MICQTVLKRRLRLERGPTAEIARAQRGTEIRLKHLEFVWQKASGSLVFRFLSAARRRLITMSR